MPESLLEEIQQDAVDNEVALTSLLRKCRILAQRIGNEDLKSWVIRELDGYPDIESLPDYRIQKNPAIFGDYLGPMQSSISNVHIPYRAFEEKHRDKIVPINVMQGVEQIRSDIDTAESGFMHILVPPDARLVVDQKIVGVTPMMVLAHLHKQLPASFLDGILSTVRNRILSFTLELEEYSEESGSTLQIMKEKQPQAVQTIFNTEIRGSVSNLSQGGDHVTQTANIQQGDIDAVREELGKLGLNAGEINDFSEALTLEKANHDGTWGDRVTAQFGKMVRKAGEGLLSIPAGTATVFLAELIKQYYGMR